MNACTVCDHKYLNQGLAMFYSLRSNTNGLTILHWLCMDDVIYEKLKKLNYPDIILYRLSDLEGQFPELRAARTNPPSLYANGNAYTQFCWACTPFFCWYLICVKELPEVLYCDADIMFYGSPQIIFDVMGKKSVGIHTHRFTGTIDQQEKLPDGIGTTNTTGWYNVGVVALRGTVQSRGITIMWKNWLLYTDHCFYKDYGNNGDQRYLELFQPLFGKENVCIFDQEGSIVHKAPWCVEGENPLFYHFSHFNYNLGDGNWRDHNNTQQPEWRPSEAPGIRGLYDDYFKMIIHCNSFLNQ